MSLIEEIQQEAVDSRSDLGTLLRKCKVLAARLKSRPLEDWLIWESNGYPDNIEVPDYRTWPLELKGHFAGQGGRLENAPIPMVCLPKNVREAYQNYECRQSVAAIEQLLGDSHDGILTVPTGDLCVFLSKGKVYRGQNCLQAWGFFGAGALIDILNSVRNRILDFSLAIWKEDPDAGGPPSNTGQKIEPAKVTQIFNTTVYGGAAHVVGSGRDSNITFDVKTNNLSSLESVLRENKIAKSDFDDLKAALREDPAPVSKGRFGPRVTSWISRMVGKACEGTWDIAVGVAAQLLAETISRYYGLR